MESCVFCQIVNQTQSAYVVSENESYLAFLDKYPYGDGHTLVIPKAHHHFIWDVPDIASYFTFTQEVAKQLKRAFNTHTTYSMIFGEQVPHAHIHLLPPLVATQHKLLTAFEGLRQPQLSPETAQHILSKLSA